MDYNKVIEELGRKKLIAMYRQMVTIRQLEESIKYLFLEGKMPGTIHQYTGMEACAVGVCAALSKRDIIASTHRPNGHAVAKGLSLKSILAELYGKKTGCSKGKGGAMHIGNIDKGMINGNAIVGANIPITVGIALAFKLKKEKRVAVSFFGDGAANEGAFHEGLNMAAVYNVPAIFVCENNQYGASTSIKKVIKIENIAERSKAYGMRGDIGDGMNILDVYYKTKEAVELARSGQGPTLLELKTFRYCGHSRKDPNNYMLDKEKEYWKKKDSIIFFEEILKKERILSKERINQIKKVVEEEITEAIKYGQEAPEPKPEETYADIYINMEVPK